MRLKIPNDLRTIAYDIHMYAKKCIKNHHKIRYDLIAKWLNSVAYPDDIAKLMCTVFGHMNKVGAPINYVANHDSLQEFIDENA